MEKKKKKTQQNKKKPLSQDVNVLKTLSLYFDHFVDSTRICWGHILYTSMNQSIYLSIYLWHILMNFCFYMSHFPIKEWHTHTQKMLSNTRTISFVLKIQNESYSFNKYVTLYMWKINHIHTVTQYKTRLSIPQIVCAMNDFKFMGVLLSGVGCSTF